MQAPWYFGAMAPTLNHQRVQDEKVCKFSEMGAWYKKGVKEGSIATKYRKGACENCGAMTHNRKDCLEVGIFFCVHYI
jgi:pre-mRNA-processing factor SLU7